MIWPKKTIFGAIIANFGHEFDYLPLSLQPMYHLIFI